jgi:hypothetical protein
MEASMSDWDRIEASPAGGGERKSRRESSLIDDDKRAGGIAGFTDEESWWRKGGSCEVVLRIVRAMTPLERVSLFANEEMRELVAKATDPVRAEWARRDAEIVPKLVEGKAKIVKKKSGIRPYWMRTAEGIDPTKKGSERIMGDWVLDVEAKCDEGELVVVGLRYPEKRYALCEVRYGARATLFGGVRPDIELDGLVPIGEWGSFAELYEAVKARFEEYTG